MLKLFIFATIFSLTSQQCFASINLESKNSEILNKGKVKKGNRYFVSKNGSDKNSGTKAFPFKTLKKAASIVVAGDTCFIYGGVYREILKVKHNGTLGNPIIFKAVLGKKLLFQQWME